MSDEQEGYAVIAYLDNMVRVFISKNPASCYSHVVLLSRNPGSSLEVRFRKRRKVIYGTEDVQARTIRLAEKFNLTTITVAQFTL